MKNDFMENLRDIQKELQTRWSVHKYSENAWKIETDSISAKRQTSLLEEILSKLKER